MGASAEGVHAPRQESILFYAFFRLGGAYPAHVVRAYFLTSLDFYVSFGTIFAVMFYHTDKRIASKISTYETRNGVILMTLDCVLTSVLSRYAPRYQNIRMCVRRPFMDSEYHTPQ